MNLPISTELYDELAERSWCGFHFLPRSDYDIPTARGPEWRGDLLRTLVFGPKYGLCVRHRASGAVLSLRSKVLQLWRSAPNGLSVMCETKTRGRLAMAFAAHPSEPWLIYVDNYGGSFAQKFTADTFGKASKIDASHAGRTVAFVDGGQMVIVGVVGSLAAYRLAGTKFVKQHEIATAVRGLTWIEERRLLLVNQGMHGLAAHRLDGAGFKPAGSLKTEGAVQQVAISHDLSHLALTTQHWAGVEVYAVGEV